MRIGMICRYDNSGLGTLSWEFAEHLKPTKVLLVSNGIFQTFPERYSEFEKRVVDSKGSVSDVDKAWILEDIDVLLSIETFYDWGIINLARYKKVKTALVTMIEMTHQRLEALPDLFLCPSKLDYDRFKNYKTNSVYIPIPLNTERLIWNKRDKANHFIHTASHGGVYGRKGTGILLEAMKSVKSDIKLTIYSWMKFISSDLRIECRNVNFKNYWDIWKEGDVLIYPQDYNGICLPIIEAMASGMGVITTDIYPFNDYFPKELMFRPDGYYKTRAGHNLLQVDAAIINPQVLAKKIDEWAGKDISKFSEYGKVWSKKNSWNYLLKQYNEALQNL